MLLNFNKLLKIFSFLIFIFFSFFFLYLGYQDLKDINFVSLIKTNEKKLNYFNYFEDKNIDTSQSFVVQEIEPSIIIEEEIVLTVKQNDTFSDLIKPYIRSNQNRQKIINAINKEFNLKKLHVGQKIFLYSSDVNNRNEILRIAIPLNFKTELVIKKNIHNNTITYSTNITNLTIATNLVAKQYFISNSLFQDGRKANVPLAILSEIIKLYSFDIDFQRDIQKGNKLEIMYKVYYNEHRRTTSYGEIEYTNLTLKNNNIEYFLFKTLEGFSDYFDREGKNVKKTLMKTPLDGAKISSNYGMRKHPILGYNKLHHGVDFAAAKGTPVYAAGNGIIEYAGLNGGYGKYIRIRHNSSYKTSYAHLTNFKKEISKGVRVNQGQIIGFVGSTGRSTGPHLHYEVIYKDKPINPMTMKLPSGKILKENELKDFKELSKTIYSNFLFYLFE